MPRTSLLRPIASALARATFGMYGLLALPSAHAHTTLANIALPPAAVAVQGPLGAPPAGTTDLKFNEVFKLPIGPKGLEPSEKLLSLHGRKVRMVGYMATQEEARAGLLILAPIPVNLGDEDESLSDDLPGNAVFVHLAPQHAGKPVPNLKGLLQMTGVLQVGAFAEPDGHVSALHIDLDESTSRLLTTLAAPVAPAQAKPRGKRAGTARQQASAAP